VRQKTSTRPSDKHKHTPPRGPIQGGERGRAHNSNSSSGSGGGGGSGSGGSGSRSSLGSSFFGRYSSQHRGGIEYMAVGTQSSSMGEALPWDLDGEDGNATDEDDDDDGYRDDDEVTSCEI